MTSKPKVAPRKRVGSLNTRGQILSEMGRVFRETRRGELTPTDGKALASVLQGMATVVKDGEAEQIMQQIAALRARMEGTAEPKSEAVTILPPPARRLGSH